jgi:hypothetical protein
MLWFFERQQAKLHYEIRREIDGPRYELAITHPDGREEVEVFADPGDALARAECLRHNLSAAGWQPPRRKLEGRG